MKKLSKGAALVALMVLFGPDVGVAQQGSAAGLPRVIERTLDQSAALGLSEVQVQQLTELRTEALTSAERLRAELRPLVDQQRAQMRAWRNEWAPLPSDPDARREAIESRRTDARARMEAARAGGRDLRERMQSAIDPLRQRYEQIVPPSQRPHEQAQRGDRGRNGQRGQMRNRRPGEGRQGMGQGARRGAGQRQQGQRGRGQRQQGRRGPGQNR